VDHVITTITRHAATLDSTYGIFLDFIPVILNQELISYRYTYLVLLIIVVGAAIFKQKPKALSMHTCDYSRYSRKCGQGLRRRRF